MKKVLILIPLENLYPPMNGGLMRGFNLLHQLSKHFELTAIIKQDIESFLRATGDFPSLKEATILSSRGQKRKRDAFDIMPDRIAQALRYRYWRRSLKGPAETNFLAFYPLLKNLLKGERFDYIILDDLSIINMADIIRRFQKDVCLLYDAYNVNTKLAAVSLTGGLISKKEFGDIEYSETHLFEYVDRIFTCSGEDLSQLIEMNNGKLKGTVIPNGVNIVDNFEKREVRGNNILFCGSLDYFPNQEGLLWFCNNVLPFLVKEMPSIRLVVVGKGDPGNELRDKLKNEAIDYYGMVDNVSVYYQRSALAIVPLLSGSGTRLKLLEAMGNKVAVVSTTIGAEGISYTNGKNIIIADDARAFASAIIDLLNKSDVAEEIAGNAFSFVKEKYDWNLVGIKLKEYLN